VIVQRWAILIVCLCLAGPGCCLAADAAVRAGLEGLVWQSYDTVHETERVLIEACRAPLLAGRDCAAALQCWFDGRIADSRGDKGAASAAWEQGLAALATTADVVAPSWPALPEGPLRPLHSVAGPLLYLINVFVITWRSDAGQQYGLLMVPRTIPRGHRFPLFAYVRRAREGIAPAEIAWLAEQCRKGYLVVAPALRGQPLADKASPQLARHRCEGTAGDAGGESSDVVTALSGAAALPVARPDACALVGLGHGAAPALLAAARSPVPTCVAVADAGCLNPFRYYWVRMARGENCWPEWAAFCGSEAAEQLASMARQSVAHQAAAIRGPVLLLLPEESLGTVHEQAHQDVVGRLVAAGREARVETIAGTRHGFSADLDADPSQGVLRRLGRFAYAGVPPDDGVDALLEPLPQPPEGTHGN
jgi:dienelactone hydrolase